ALLHGEIEKLGRQSMSEEFLRDWLDISVLARAQNCFGVAVRRLPPLDVALYLVNKALRHVEFAFAENARYPQNQLVLLRHFGVVNVESGEKPVVTVFHIAAPRSKLLNFCHTGLALALLDNAFNVSDIHVKRLHGIE